MPRIGYTLSSEEHDSRDLVSYATQAEDAGFDFLMISDHFHPWTNHQGHSPFVWSVLGAVAHATERVRVGTGVTCPLIRIHPSIIAHAAATTADLMPGRFSLGLGTGENLNEHIQGDRWPPAPRRLEMLTEAITIIRSLWTGKPITHHGDHYCVENARIYTLPPEPPPIIVAASGSRSVRAAAELGDGLVSMGPDPDLVRSFNEKGGSRKPTYVQLHVCWAPTEDEARRVAHQWWPNAGLKGELGQELPLPRHFEQATQLVGEADVAESVIAGPDAEPYIKAIRDCTAAGYDHVYLHQIGPAQEEFIRFSSERILPKVR